MKTLTITIALTLLVAFSAQATVPVVDSSTIAYWTFDDPLNLGADSVGNNDLSNFGTPTGGTGLDGGSLELDGVSTLQFVPNVASTINDIPGGFTVELWAKTDLQAQSGFFFRRDGWMQGGGVWSEMLSYFFIWGEDGLQQWQVAHPRLDANSQWHHMVYVFDPANDVYYMLNDGVLVGLPYGFAQGDWPTPSEQLLGYVTPSLWTITFALGGVENSGGFDGSMDSVMISNRATYDMDGVYIPIPEPTALSLLGLLVLLRRKK